MTQRTEEVAVPGEGADAVLVPRQRAGQGQRGGVVDAHLGAVGADGDDVAVLLLWLLCVCVCVCVCGG